MGVETWIMSRDSARMVYMKGIALVLLSWERGWEQLSGSNSLILPTSPACLIWSKLYSSDL